MIHDRLSRMPQKYHVSTTTSIIEHRDTASLIHFVEKTETVLATQILKSKVIPHKTQCIARVFMREHQHTLVFCTPTIVAAPGGTATAMSEESVDSFWW